LINTSTKVAPVGSQEWTPLSSVLPGSAPSGVGAPPPVPAAAPVISQPVLSAPAAQVQPGAGPTEPLAIWSLVLSLVGLFCCGFVFAIPGVVLGHLAMSKINKNPALGGKGLAVAGLCIGYFASVAWLVYLFAMGGLAVFSSLTQHS
jgi:hypothetical protein